MSDSDSFINEVTEELRRDRMNRALRKYGWIAILAVLLVVGGAAFNEWRKASDQAAAEVFGDALTAALEISDPAAQASAFAEIAAEDDARAIIALLAASVRDARGNPKADAVTQLRQVIADEGLSQKYRDLAVLKLVGLGNIPAEERLNLLTPLTSAGAAFRVLAEEQIALIEIEMGQVDAAITRLQMLLADDEASQALRDRAAQLIVALGAAPES